MISMEKRMIGIIMLSVGLAGIVISFIIMISDMASSHLGISAYTQLYPLTSHGMFMIMITHVFIIVAAIGFYLEEITRPNIKAK